MKAVIRSCYLDLGIQLSAVVNYWNLLNWYINFMQLETAVNVWLLISLACHVSEVSVSLSKWLWATAVADAQFGSQSAYMWAMLYAFHGKVIICSTIYLKEFSSCRVNYQWGRGGGGGGGVCCKGDIFASIPSRPKSFAPIKQPRRISQSTLTKTY